MEDHSVSPYSAPLLYTLAFIENINFVHLSFSPQVDFPVDFTRQNPSRVDIKR